MNASLLELVWDAVPYPALVIDGAGQIAAANTAAEALGSTSLKQMRGQPLARYLGQKSALTDVVDQARRGIASVVQHDVEVFWSDRPAGSFTVHVAQLNDGGDGLLILLHPRSMAERMDRSLTHRSAARTVTGMAAMLAHEIRNPLAGIAGAAQLLSMSTDDRDHMLTELIQEEAQRIGKLVERVEQFGELRPAKHGPINIHTVIDRAKRSAAAGFARHARFIEQFDPSLPPTHGDADQLLQVFQNLFKNAAEAIPEVGGQIHIRTGYQPGVKLALPGGQRESLPLVVTITDNGPGIPETLIKDIFEPFVTAKSSGTGLGLALVSKIVTDHGGVIDCESAPGRTRFHLHLPVSHAEAAPEQSAATAPEDATQEETGT